MRAGSGLLRAAEGGEGEAVKPTQDQEDPKPRQGEEVLQEEETGSVLMPKPPSGCPAEPTAVLWPLAPSHGLHLPSVPHSPMGRGPEETSSTPPHPVPEPGLLLCPAPLLQASRAAPSTAAAARRAHGAERRLACRRSPAAQGSCSSRVFPGGPPGKRGLWPRSSSSLGAKSQPGGCPRAGEGGDSGMGSSVREARTLLLRTGPPKAEAVCALLPLCRAPCCLFQPPGDSLTRGFAHRPAVPAQSRLCPAALPSLGLSSPACGPRPCAR